MNKNIEELVEHTISNEELKIAEIEYADFGIKIQMVDAEEIYLTKKGISIRTKDKYLLVNDLKEYINKANHQRQEIKNNYFDLVP